MEGIYFPLVIAAALGAGLMAGTFFVFSIAVMPALNRLPPAQAIATMQAINVAILTPVFLSIFIGVGVICIILPVAILNDWSVQRAVWMFTGGLIYLFGSLLVTIALNVPLNDRLARQRADDPAAETIWRDYSVPWTRWNHLRAAAALVASYAFVMSLR